MPEEPQPDPASPANPNALEAPNSFNTSPGFIVFFHANIQYFDPTVGPGFAHNPRRLVDCWFDKNCVGDYVPDVIALTECPWNADAKAFMAYLSTRAATLSPARTYKLWVTTGGNKYGSKCVIFSNRFSPGNKATDFTEFSRYEPDVQGVPDNTCTVHPNNEVTHNFKVRLYDTIAQKTVRVVTIHNPVFAESAQPDECFHANGDAECALQNSKEAWHQATNTASADAMRIIAGDFNMTQRCPTPGYYRDNCTSSILGCFDGAARVGYTPGYQYLINQGFKSIYGNDATGRDPDVDHLKIDHVLAKAYRAWPWSAANTSARPSTSKIIPKNYYGNFDRFTDHWYLYVGQAHY